MFCVLEQADGKQFIQYRNSKLTMLLKDSIGGNSKTAVISNISASHKFEAQTTSTLKFASHLKFIRNSAKLNVSESSDMKVLQKETASLRKQISFLEQALDEANGDLAKAKANSSE